MGLLLTVMALDGFHGDFFVQRWIEADLGAGHLLESRRLDVFDLVVLPSVGHDFVRVRANVVTLLTVEVGGF